MKCYISNRLATQARKTLACLATVSVGFSRPLPPPSIFLHSPQFSRGQKAKNASNGRKKPTETLARQARKTRKGSSTNKVED